MTLENSRQSKGLIYFEITWIIRLGLCNIQLRCSFSGSESVLELNNETLIIDLITPLIKTTNALLFKNNLPWIFEVYDLLLFQLFHQDIRELVWYAVAETCALKTLVRSVTHAQHALLWPQEGKKNILI